MQLSDNTSISLPARNLLAILAAVAIGTMSYFSVIERLNKIETTLQLMEKDLEAANTFIDSVPKGGMVSPQVQELYMLVEYLGENVDKLKEQMEAEIPMILKNDMVIQFHEERLIDLEERKNGNH
jgi:dynactin complex subunit